MAATLVRLLLVSLLAATAASAATNSTRTQHHRRPPYNVHLLRHRTGAAGRHIPFINCLSWRLGVETNNIRDWHMVPRLCQGYVGHYMLGRQYHNDCAAVAAAALRYLAGLRHVNKDGKDVWVFDIDETALSNLPYYARADVGFGAKAYNETKFEEWVKEAKAPAMPETLRLYRRVLSMGIKVVFISATKEELRPARVLNLHQSGFRIWESLILRERNETGGAVVEYKTRKRTELVKKGYRIVGNIGDQWSDLVGENVGFRTFKMPDPMYYVA
ncbi:hypothetical protein DM860_008948 [Cuscuta australis]|uniref:Acid phosphatase n=1 Tax=Cuscuta australis TaxID=267555 RepID=A0A328D8F4_9ASTE|nr:hypothetical protein DM860_008948 [Cuscuta australis]